MAPWAIRALIALAVLAGVALGAGRWGYRLAADACQAREAERLAAEIRARDEDLARAQAVSAAYAQLAEQLRRVAAAQRLEVSREVVRVEYRCPVPEPGRLLLDAAQARARAAAGGAADPVPDARAP